MEFFLEVLHVYIKNVLLFLVIIVTIICWIIWFEWLKLNHMTNRASQCIAAKIDYDLRWSLCSVNYYDVAKQRFELKYRIGNKDFELKYRIGFGFEKRK